MRSGTLSRNTPYADSKTPVANWPSGSVVVNELAMLIELVLFALPAPDGNAVGNYRQEVNSQGKGCVLARPALHLVLFVLKCLCKGFSINAKVYNRKKSKK